jgi:hypothetical protein
MGLLDDAIREHLELKRRAGADAMDVARQEREALGGGGRSDPLAEPPPEDEPYAEVPRPAGARPYDGPYDDEPEDDDDYQEPHYAPPPPAVTPLPPPPAPVQAAPPPPPRPVQPPPVRTPPAGPPTEEYVIPAGEAEDVLEQTPDFLQETPEHDRLWFEQAPPQEFDFDK